MATEMDVDTVTNPRPLRLALQGGGAHGAFTWGVLDRLLEEPGLPIEAVSGTSAGAMNAVVLADGLLRGGRQGARDALAAFWQGVGKAAALSPFRRGVVDRLSGRASLDRSPGFLFFDGLSRYVSPYDLNPLGLNPLRNLVEQQVDFEALNGSEAIAVHVTATHVHTGLPRIFSNGALSVDAVMASACLPQLFPAVEIEGEAYWDGGYTGNPSLFPLVEGAEETDLFIVQINPIRRDGVPHSARDIINRVNEITFNAALLKEFRAMEFVERLLESGRVDKEHYKKLRMHRIDATDAFEGLNASSKMNTDRDFLLHLKQMGRDCAWRWMKTDGKKVGKESTLKLRDHIERVEIHMED